VAEISLKGINKTYPGNVTAVHDFNLEIEDKEFIILVGPSGCGKSTMLRMVAGLEDITEGELYIGDKHCNDVAPKDRDIAMVFQNYALYPHMSVYKNMAFGLSLRKMAKDEIDTKVRQASKILGIEHLLERKPKALSGGERQRVALGRAMVRNPAVFLLDEPLSKLDAKLRTSMRAELIKLHKSLGTTFIYVTHDQVEAMTMGDRIVVMNDGVIQQVDTPQNLYDNPCNLFVAGFIGTPPMNLMDGTVVKTGEKYIVRIGRNEFPILPSRFTYEKIAPYAGKTIVFGFRPENLHLDCDYANESHIGLLDADVELVELMGSEVYAYCVCGGSNLIAKIPTHSGAKAGDRIKIAVDGSAIYLFDKETRRHIGL